MGNYDVAQVCYNGHVTNSKTHRNPQDNKNFCDECGEKTITECPSCQFPIQGEYCSNSGGVILVGNIFYPPAFCQSCGKPFPWTLSKQQAAIQLYAEEETATIQDQNEFQQSVIEITKNTPQSQVASKKITRLLAKIGKESASAIRDILVDVASEAVKKSLLPDKP